MTSRFPSGKTGVRFPVGSCLYSNNANLFMPIDGLADVGEYTSRKILNLID
jgi:hypothetical protein